MEPTIEQWIEEHQKQMLEDIAALVRIPSVASVKETKVSGEPFGKACRNVLDKMKKIADREGICGRDAEGYYLSLEAGEGETQIGVWSHLDVVPEGDGWIYPPFVCTRKGDYLIGRGVQDNKGPAIAVFYAICYCKEHNLLKSIRIRHLLGCQEESGMQDVAHFLEKKEEPAFSFVTDCGFPVCCGEKGILRISFKSAEKMEEFSRLQAGVVCNSVPSSAEAEIQTGNGCTHLTADGIGGHAAFPEGTVNAVSVLLQRLEEYSLRKETEKALAFLRLLAADGYGKAAGIACSDEVSGSLTCNLGILCMEEGYIRAEVDIRYPVSVKSEDFLPVLLKKAEMSGMKLIYKEDSKPYYMEKEHPFVQVLMRTWKEETGQDGEPYVMGGGTYAKKLPHTVAFGPGMPKNFQEIGLPEGHGNCHGADEAETITNLKKAVKIYIKAFINLDKWVKERKENENVSD